MAKTPFALLWFTRCFALLWFIKIAFKYMQKNTCFIASGEGMHATKEFLGCRLAAIGF